MQHHHKSIFFPHDTSAFYTDNKGIEIAKPAYSQLWNKTWKIPHQGIITRQSVGSLEIKDDDSLLGLGETKDTDEEIDEQELEAHYSYMAKIQEVSPEETSSSSQPLEQEMHDDLEYVKSLEKEMDELESEKADFSNIYDLLLEEFARLEAVWIFIAYAAHKSFSNLYRDGVGIRHFLMVTEGGAEAEDVGFLASCAQVMWMRTQLKDYGFNYNKIPLYYDSQSATIAISGHPRTFSHLREKAHPYFGFIFIMEQVMKSILDQPDRKESTQDNPKLEMQSLGMIDDESKWEKCRTKIEYQRKTITTRCLAIDIMIMQELYEKVWSKTQIARWLSPIDKAMKEQDYNEEQRTPMYTRAEVTKQSSLEFIIECHQ
ncbi:hypothetical protein Tco_0090041 [Tanacetum coccineum]